MSTSQPIYCLSSDEDDDDSDLLNGSFLRKPPAAPVVTQSSSNDTSSSNSNGSSCPRNQQRQETRSNASLNQPRESNNNNSLLQKVMQEQSSSPTSRQQQQQQHRQSVASAYSLGSAWSPPLTYPDDSNNDDDSSCLEVLPAQNTPPSSKRGEPRLSFTGQDIKDPVQLLDDEYDAVGIPLTMAAQSMLQQPHVKQEESKNSPLSVDAKPTAASRVRAAVKSVLDDSLSCSSADQVQPKLVPAAKSQPSTLSFTQDNHINITTRRRTAPSSPLLGSSSSDDDSDDSFAKKCLDFQARRKRARPAPVTASTDPKQTPCNSTSPPSIVEPAPKATKKPKAAKETSTNDGAPSLTAAEREAQKQAARAAKQHERQAARLAKEREKQAAKEHRQREKLAKEQAQQQAKRQKQEAKQQNNQQRGRYANQEIAVLIEPTLLDGMQNPWKIRATLEGSGFTHVQPYPAGLSCNAIQFVRQEFLQGGASQAVQDLMQKGPPRPGQEAGYQHITILGIVLEAHTLIELIQGNDADNEDDLTTARVSADDDDYPSLEQWLFGLVAGWRAAWHKTAADRPRIILLLYKVQECLDRLWVQYNRSRHKGRAPPNTEQLHDAILWMLIQFQVESIHCSTPEDVGHEIFKMTRLLAETPYVKQATDLQTIAKLPAHVSDMAPSFDRARDTWIRQLQQIPGISAEKATNISKHYPTAMSLWKVYQDESIPTHEKELLLADLFGTKSSQSKLSQHVYRALTSDNPAEILS